MSRTYGPNRRAHHPSIIDDRVRRYLTGEPLRLIAQDHGVGIEAICRTITRHAPSIAGTRTRGGGPRQWPA